MQKRKPSRQSQTENQTLLSMERTILSKERTILSFMQTGLAFIGVGIVIINVFQLNYTSVFVGSILIMIGFLEILESLRRLLHYRKIMSDVRKMLGKYAI